MIAIINGPNLNMLGRRDPNIYGSTTFEDFLPQAEDLVSDLSDGLETLEYYQSNSEGDIVSHIQKLAFDPVCRGIVINPGAYAHYSYAIHDAVEMSPIPVIVVHISNIHSREDFRHNDVIVSAAKGTICGLGLEGYLLALRAILS
ncbi:MAG: 3-dehydroquinate dehydratase [Muribaculaceae bacterium]|nr:3-dehydroquinate dehydratase [Muribaculaceae bacterium]MDE6633430.1 3-dehydroquinate dehydratase [Muribaculaceae bacterium]